MKLLIDPAIVGTDRNPTALTVRYDLAEVRYGYYPADETSLTTPRCDRCNDLLHHHLWQLLNGNNVIDCGRGTR